MKLSFDWIAKPWVELFLICLLPFLCLLCVIIFPNIFQAQLNVSSLWWFALVLLIDVSHVYTTLYRTYFDVIQWQKHKLALIIIPILVFLVSLLLQHISMQLFWRVLAYIAVFHFVRQQYGLLRLYERNDTNNILKKMHQVVIYTASIYPLIYWHCYGPFEFNWFIGNDFIFLQNTWIEKCSFVIYVIILVCYVVMNLYYSLRDKRINLTAHLILIGTLISWYFAIVYFKSDLTFTFLNIITHGIPYMALVWVMGKRNAEQAKYKEASFMHVFFRKYAIFLFLLIPFILGYVEEGLWDTFLWNERQEFFSVFRKVKQFIPAQIYPIIIAFLAVPQFTHYVLDGFIWRISKGHIES